MGTQYPPSNADVTNAQYPPADPQRDPLLPQDGFTDETSDMPSLNQRDVRQVPVSDMLDQDNLTGVRTPVDLGPQSQPQGGGGQPVNNVPGGGPQVSGGGNLNPPAFFPAFDPFVGTSRLGLNAGGIGAGALAGVSGDFSNASGAINHNTAADGGRFDNPQAQKAAAAALARYAAMRTGQG